MGLLDKKSESKNIFIINSGFGSTSFDWFDYDGVTKPGQSPVENRENYFPEYSLIKKGFEPNTPYSFNKLIDLDLSDVDSISKLRIRELLFSNDLVNENDRQLMLKYGVKEEHIQLLVRDLGLDTRSRNVLCRYADYAWEILRFNLDDISRFRNCGPTSAINIARKYKSLGYTIEGYTEEYYPEVSEEDKLLNSIHKVEASRQVYVNKVANLNKKIDEADQELVRLNLELEKIRIKKN